MHPLLLLLLLLPRVEGEDAVNPILLLLPLLLPEVGVLSSSFSGGGGCCRSCRCFCLCCCHGRCIWLFIH
jgi:hypothetical protein